MLQFNPHHLHIIRERQKLRAQSEEREHKSRRYSIQYTSVITDVLSFCHLGFIHDFLQLLGLTHLFSA